MIGCRAGVRLALVNPATKSAGADRQAAAVAFADAYTPDTEPLASARTGAAALGLDAVSPGAAALLTLLARTIDARAVVEVGTGAGVSSLALLAGMAPDGVLTSIDFEPQHQAAARAAVAKAGIAARRARLIAGSALSVLPKLSDGAYDIVFLDADPLEYVEYIEQAARLLRSGGLLFVHNALAGGTVADDADTDDETVIIREALAAVHEMPEFAPVLLPVSSGLLVALRS